MSNFTNEVPENMDEIIQRLRLYIDKSYNKPDKSKIQKIVSNFNLSLTKQENGVIDGDMQKQMPL